MSVPRHDDDFGGELRASTCVATSTMLKHKHLSHGSKKALERRFTLWAKCCILNALRSQRYLPTIHAQLALAHDGSSKAVAPYELGAPGSSVVSAGLNPVYVRGEAYLAAYQGSEAAAEFQKILDHRGVVVNSQIGALAPLGLARAYSLQGDTVKARAAYQNFLTLWKDADSDIPLLIQAKAEYAKLH